MGIGTGHCVLSLEEIFVKIVQGRQRDFQPSCQGMLFYAVRKNTQVGVSRKPAESGLIRDLIWHVSSESILVYIDQGINNGKETCDCGVAGEGEDN